MLWPYVVPVKIAFWSLLALVVLVTLLAPLVRWNRSKAFAISAVTALLAFIPLTGAIVQIMDASRFGRFEYATYDEVNDFRVERYLPPAAREIALLKYAGGYRTRYSITEEELTEYLDGLWDTYGQRSAVPRDDLGEGEPVSAETFEHEFRGEWPNVEGTIQYHSPIEADGGGATYYFDRASGIAYQRAGYW